MIAQPFTLPDDGWFQISAIGDFPHATTGLVQVIDADAVSAIVQKFTEESVKPNFPGVLVDWDHASLDLDKPTEAAGWIMNLQQRPDGLWGQVRWSDRGAEAISGGRYRFMSPVWRQEDCLSLGEKKVRPLRLFNCALTNDPNIKGMVPLANRKNDETDQSMDYKSLLLNMLGLAENADDTAVTTAVANAKAKMASPGKDEDMCNRLRGEVEVLTNRNKELEKVVIEADVVKYRGLGLKDEDLRAQLVANRAGTVKILDAIIANKKAGKDASEDGRQIHNANERRTPQAAPASEKERADRIDAEVRDYQIANRGTSYEAAHDHVRRHKPELFRPIEAETN